MRERFKQIRIYLGTFLRLFLKTGGWKALLFGAVISFIIVLVVGDDMFVYGANTESGCFVIISACIWIGIFNSIQVICKERDIIKREHRSGMHISSYVLARAIYELILCFVQAGIMFLICSVFMSYPENGLVSGVFSIDLFITMFLSLLCADYLGIAVSCIVKTTTTAMTVMPFILIVQLVLCGVLFKLEGIIEYIANITISKWGMQAVGALSDINHLQYNELGWVRPEKDAYLYESTHMMKAWCIIAGFAVIYLIIGIICLEFVDRDKR